MSLVRCIDSEGRIVIPISAREILKIDSSCDIIIKESICGLGIFIRRNYCIFCGSTASTNKFKGHEVCRSCIDNIVIEAKPLPTLDKVVYNEPIKPSILKIKQLLKTSPDMKQYQIAEILGVSKPRVSQLMKKIRQMKSY